MPPDDVEAQKTHASSIALTVFARSLRGKMIKKRMRIGNRPELELFDREAFIAKPAFHSIR